ncbi:unnamed protein product [Absidia cylindrospora]
MVTTPTIMTTNPYPATFSYTQGPDQGTHQLAPFNEQVCLQWFQIYADPDMPTCISPEGTLRFLQDLGIAMDEKMVIVISWKLNVASMGYITQHEWVTSMRELQVDSNEGLIKRRHEFESILEKDDPVSFQSLYRYTFDYGRNKNQKSMDVAVACTLWLMLLGDTCTLVQSFIHFLQVACPVRVINRDQWNSFYDFISTVSHDLSDHDEMAAWPVLFDSFVDWKRNSIV